MKKVKNIAKTMLIISLCFSSLFLFSGCGKKEAISAEKFRTKMENKGFTVRDVTNQFQSEASVKQGYAASNNKYQIEFYDLESNSSAVSMYNHNLNKFKEEVDNSNATKSNTKEMSNYARYAAIANGKYKVLSRIDNTLIYINADSNYKDEIKEILDDLGY